eukprot:102186_1
MGSCGTKIPNSLPQSAHNTDKIVDDENDLSEDALRTYQKLINMNFDENVSMKASKKYPGNLQNAINFILEMKKNDIDDNMNNAKKTPNIQPVDSCKNIEKCNCLSRLIVVLKHCQQYKTDKMELKEIAEYFRINKSQIINDYHHILEHLNEDKIGIGGEFKVIYDLISQNIKCDIKECHIYTRNNRLRERGETVYAGVDLLDTIHCYLLHSVDIGYKIIMNELEEMKYNESEEDGMADNECYDKELSKLTLYLQSKRKNVEQTRGSKRMQQSKFITQLTAANDEKKKTKHSNNTYYSFGLRYNYWDHDGNAYDYNNLKPKYPTLKNELTQNLIYIIDLSVFDSIYQRAEDLMKESMKIKSIKCKDDDYGNKLFGPLSLQHILSVLFYTDCDSLSFNFSKTFRQETEFEKVRNIEYGNWTKYLVETVNCYGTMMQESDINVLYHGISFMYFDKFISTFNSPTSTTTKLQIATIFAMNGVILELTKYNTFIALGYRYFNCSFFSSFGNEEERLFIQPKYRESYLLKTVAIINMRTNENYKYIIKVLSSLENIFSNNLKETVAEKEINKMNEILIPNHNESKNPQYIDNLLPKWKKSVYSIELDRRRLTDYAKNLAIWDESVNNLIRYDLINSVFNNTKYVTCWGVGRINDSYFKSLLSIIKSVNQLDHSDLIKVSLYGTKNDYSASQLAKYTSLFAVNGWQISECDWGLSLLRQ